jgi:hypothetical protein
MPYVAGLVKRVFPSESMRNKFFHVPMAMIFPSGDQTEASGAGTAVTGNGNNLTSSRLSGRMVSRRGVEEVGEGVGGSKLDELVMTYGVIVPVAVALFVMVEDADKDGRNGVVVMPLSAGLFSQPTRNIPLMIRIIIINTRRKFFIYPPMKYFCTESIKILVKNYRINST